MSYSSDVMWMRNEWRESLLDPNTCMYCQKSETWPGLQIHEIERRSQAPKRWAHKSNFLLLCQHCHSEEFGAMPHSRQLAVKLLRDPEHFGVSEWLQIRDPELKAPYRVTMRQVMEEFQTINLKGLE